MQSLRDKTILIQLVRPRGGIQKLRSELELRLEPAGVERLEEELALLMLELDGVELGQ